MQLLNSSGENSGGFDLLANSRKTISSIDKSHPQAMWGTGLIVNGKGKLSNPQSLPMQDEPERRTGFQCKMSLKD
jgi:hypothetical protein